jgi:hypothetical protein
MSAVHVLESDARRGAHAKGADQVRESEAPNGSLPAGAEALLEIDAHDGAHAVEGVDVGGASDSTPGPLQSLIAAWTDVQRTRLALDQRGIPSDGMRAIEDRLGRQIRRELEGHPLWPWLKQFPGLGGVHTARLIALIGDPHRFPGRVCAAGHHHSAAGHVLEIDTASGCGIELADGSVCPAPVGELRRGTGTRALWHYLGLHVVDGHAPRKVKGKRSDWSPAGRTAVLMPGGVADQIVRLRVPKYRDIYDVTKERLQRERADVTRVIDDDDGPLPTDEAEAEGRPAIGYPNGLRPYAIDAIARKVAAKAFVADLLHEWKQRSGYEPHRNP